MGRIDSLSMAKRPGTHNFGWLQEQCDKSKYKRNIEDVHVLNRRLSIKRFMMYHFYVIWFHVTETERSRHTYRYLQVRFWALASIYLFIIIFFLIFFIFYINFIRNDSSIIIWNLMLLYQAFWFHCLKSPKV